MIQSPPLRPPFDGAAQERVAVLFRRCPPREFIATLHSYDPSTRDEQAAYEKFYGWALYDGGDYARARSHLLLALRKSGRGSRDRAVARGLLAESCLRTGELEAAERCTHRGLSQIPAEDGDHYLRAGYLCLLGRIRRRQGHVTHAVETYRRALSLIDERSPHWTPLIESLAIALLAQAHANEADALIRSHRRSAASELRPYQEWILTSAEVHVAIALGDLERAERLWNESLALYGERLGERIWLILTDLRAAVHRARKDWGRSEALLRRVLERCEPGGRNGDMVACAARGLAESLEGQGRFEEALDPARLGVRAGCVEDRLEWATALHVLGRCLDALGRGEEARRVFREALSLHERTQFDAERARLQETLRGLGFTNLEGELGASGADVERRAAEVLRVPLADGRVFLTSDAQLLDDIRTAAGSDLPALIEGATGTGKEIVARLLHELGPRSPFPFVIVDCTTLPQDLADVELFGAARGAYTGAHRERAGLIAQADRGTIFFDEIPELSTALQSKLLRVLQEGTYRRVGEDQFRRVRLRFVAATNRSVEQLLKTGALKPDLFYRLNGYRLALEPLRDRRGEIGPLANEIARRCGLAGVSPAALELLQAWPWPGNVRQLEMMLRVAACHCAVGGFLDRGDVESRLVALPDLPHHEDSLRAGRIAGERATLLRAMEESGGVVTRAARSLGLSRQGFYKALRRTGLASDLISSVES